MQVKKVKAWLLSAVIAGGVAGFVPTASTIAYARDNDEWVKYEDCPRAVRNAIDGERGREDVKRIDRVRSNGRVFYRATIDSRGGSDDVIRVSEDGRILSRQEASDPDDRRDYRGSGRGVSRDINGGGDTSGEQVKYASLPNRVKDALDRERGGRDIKSVYRVDRRGETTYRATINDRVGDRVVTVNENGRVVDSYGGEARTASERYDSDRGSSRGVRRDVYDDRPDYSYRNSGEYVDYDRLPGEVKTVIGREARSDRVRNVVRFNNGGRTVYEAVVGDRNDPRVIRVDERGRLLDDRDDFGSGRRGVSYNRLPGEVKTAIGSRMNDVEHVTEYTRGGRTYYRATGANGDHLTVDDRGRVVED